MNKKLIDYLNAPMSAESAENLNLLLVLLILVTAAVLPSKKQRHDIDLRVNLTDSE